MPVIDDRLSRTLALIGSFYDACKVGYQGNEGYRKSTDLCKFAECIRELLAEGFIDPNRTVFTDLGCADGRVNVMMSYFVRTSIGIEIAHIGAYPDMKTLDQWYGHDDSGWPYVTFPASVGTTPRFDRTNRGFPK